MRQIKFRVWDKKYKQYIICGYPYGGDAVYSMNPFSGKFQILNASYDYDSGVDIQAKEPDVILEQFTGLCDKDGREIYEGDVVVSPNYPNNKMSIVWNEELFKWCVYYKSTWGKSPVGIECIQYDCEVIGNIHENKP